MKTLEFLDRPHGGPLLLVSALSLGLLLWTLYAQEPKAILKIESANPSESLFSPPTPVTSENLQILLGHKVALKGACLPHSLGAYFSAADGGNARVACQFAPTESIQTFPLLVGTMSRGSVNAADWQNTFQAFLKEDIVVVRVSQGRGFASPVTALPAPLAETRSEAFQEISEQSSPSVVLTLLN
jgi:hypothetical protein